jgi:hypothetical protein
MVCFVGSDDIQYGKINWNGQGKGKPVSIRLMREGISTAIKVAIRLGAEIITVKANADMAGLEFNNWAVFLSALEIDNTYSKNAFKKIAWKPVTKNSL